MDYWRLLRPAGRGIILVSLLNWMRARWTRASRVKVIGLTSEYHVCNLSVWYLCSMVQFILGLFSRDDKLPGFYWSSALWQSLLRYQPIPASKVKWKYKLVWQTSPWFGYLSGCISIYYLFMLANRSSVVISMAKRNKWSMFFKAVKKGPHCGGEIGKFVQFPVSNGK